ncbi:hypothetical protein PEL8287_03028 [Roseovarius litorisediminis]|uniref:YiaA/B two helix domain protein n=1 Tax=Roseovarius litorisediminis TaxID=1312363 RepID=A0A1Y5T6E1_9RHOB|nr:hypothetical protein [Roseovarius litorisediminis]SLN56383.1 hypothetical protein PEL8287_03028 [Roseovarius litorisediminis]
MYNNDKPDNTVIMMFNLAGVAAAYGLLTLSLYMSPDVPLSTKGFWGMGILMLTLSLVNFVKYRFDNQARIDRINRIEEAKNEKLLEDYVGDNYPDDKKDLR